MTPALLRRAVRNYTSPFVPLALNKRNRREWLRAWAALGDKALIAKPLERKQ